MRLTTENNLFIRVAFSDLCTALAIYYIQASADSAIRLTSHKKHVIAVLRCIWCMPDNSLSALRPDKRRQSSMKSRSARLLTFHSRIIIVIASHRELSFFNDLAADKSSRRCRRHIIVQLPLLTRMTLSWQTFYWVLKTICVILMFSVEVDFTWSSVHLLIWCLTTTVNIVLNAKLCKLISRDHRRFLYSYARRRLGKFEEDRKFHNLPTTDCFETHHCVWQYRH